MSCLDFRELRDLGFQGVVFDKDNTLTLPYKDEFVGRLKPSIDVCKGVFGNSIAIMSNSAGSSDDDDFKEAARIEGHLGMHVVRHNSKVCVCCYLPKPV